MTRLSLLGDRVTLFFDEGLAGHRAGVESQAPALLGAGVLTSLLSCPYHSDPMAS